MEKSGEDVVGIWGTTMIGETGSLTANLFPRFKDGGVIGEIVGKKGSEKFSLAKARSLKITPGIISGFSDDIEKMCTGL